MTDEIMMEQISSVEFIEEIPEPAPRLNPFCVIRKEPWGAYNSHDIQSNSAWGGNPYGEDYAIVPDEMVQAIMETRGFCDIELNEEGTEITGFTALEIPEIPEPEPEPTADEKRDAQIFYTAMMTDTLLEEV